MAETSQQEVCGETVNITNLDLDGGSLAAPFLHAARWDEHPVFPPLLPSSHYAGRVVTKNLYMIMDTLNKGHNRKNLPIMNTLGLFSIMLVHFNLRREDNFSIKTKWLLPNVSIIQRFHCIDQTISLVLILFVYSFPLFPPLLLKPLQADAVHTTQLVPNTSKDNNKYNTN